MKNEITTLHVIDFLGTGGGENQFVQTVQKLNILGLKSQVYCAQYKGPRAVELEQAGIAVYALQDKSGPRNTFKSIFLLYRLLQKNKPDILHSYLMYASWVAAAARLFYRPKILFLGTEFCTPSQMLSYVKFAALKGFVLKKAYAQMNLLVATSEQVAQELVEQKMLPCNKVTTIPEGVNLSVLIQNTRAQARQVLGLGLDQRILVVAGTLVERKGHRFLLEALPFLIKKWPELRLLVVGSGALEGELKRLTENLGLNQTVRFEGFQTGIQQYIKAADILVLPSLFEGMPNVVMEAMALGTAVVASNIYGLRDLLISGVDGMLVPPAQTKELENTLYTLLSDDVLRSNIAEQAQKKIKNYTFENCAQRYINLYRKELA